MDKVNELKSPSSRTRLVTNNIGRVPEVKVMVKNEKRKNSKRSGLNSFFPRVLRAIRIRTRSQGNRYPRGT